MNDAVATLVSEIAIPDTGSTRGDLPALMGQAVELYGGSLAPRLMASLVGEARRDPELANTARNEFLAGQRAAPSAWLQRAIRHREPRRGPDCGLAPHRLGGSVCDRPLP